MKIDNNNGKIKYVAFAVLTILLGILAIYTSQTSRNPIRSVLYGVVMIGAGIVVIVCTVVEIIKSKK